MCKLLEFILLGKFMPVPKEIGCRYRPQRQCYWYKNRDEPVTKKWLQQAGQCFESQKPTTATHQIYPGRLRMCIAKRALALHAWCARCAALDLRTAAWLHGGVNKRWPLCAGGKWASAEQTDKLMQARGESRFQYGFARPQSGFTQPEKRTRSTSNMCGAVSAAKPITTICTMRISSGASLTAHQVSSAAAATAAVGAMLVSSS